MTTSTTGASVRLPAAFTGFPGIVLLLTADGTILESNGRLDAEVGYSVVGRPFASVLDSASCGEKWTRVLSGATKPNGATTCELVLVYADTVAEPRSFSLLGDSDGSVVWLIEHPRDPRLDVVREEVTGVNSELATTQRDLVRERARLAHALDETERSNRALDEFAHAVSHDLKAPLRSVANYARWIEEDVGHLLAGETRAHMELLRAQVDRMRAMINGALEYARSGRGRVPTESVDAAALVAEVIALLDPPSTCQVLADDLPTFLAERAPLRQVLMNLIGNAIKHSCRSDAVVRVRAVDVGDAYEFTVQDNGPGIAARAHEKIWMLFHTLTPREANASGATEGTGIGLAIVRQLVELQGGRAWVESELGKGATFHFVWPKRDTSPASDATESVDQPLDR